MKKVIYVSELLAFLLAEIDERGEPTENIYNFVKSLTKKCPSAYSGENELLLPIALNQTVWSKDGRRGTIDSFT